MALQSKRILILGSTGVIGQMLTDAIINEKSNFERIGIFTSHETASRKKELIECFESQGVEIIIGDILNAEDVLNAYRGFDTVVSAVGRFAIDAQVDLIALAERSPNIIRFFPSEFGTDIAYDLTSSAEVPSQKKIKVRSYLESSAVTRLKHTYLVTGPFANLYLGSMAAEPEIGSFDVDLKAATLLGDGKGRISLTAMADVGRFLVAALKHPEICDNKAVKVNSFTTTPQEILAEFERQTRRKWSVEYTGLDALRQLEAKAWKNENPLASIYTLRRIWTEGRTLYENVDNEAIGVMKTDTLEMAVQEAIARPSSGFRSGKL